MSAAPRKRVKAFGAEFDVVDFTGVCRAIEMTITKKAQIMIGYQNLHGAYLTRYSPKLREFLMAADIVYADGMPLVLWRRFLHGDCSRRNRFTLSQVMPALLSFCSERNYRVYYLGSEERAVRQGWSRLHARFPNLRYDFHHGFFDRKPGSSENEAMIGRINAFRPDIVMVGMGMPIQEQWLLENHRRLLAPVLYASGAAIECFSGEVAIAPALLSNSGFEWLFRLAGNPAKFWRRYLVEPFSLIGPAVAEIVERLANARR